MPLDDAAFTEYLKNPILFPSAFKDWVSDWYATNLPKLHVSQIFGFKLQSIHCATDVATAESTTSTTYTDLATPGPTLSNLPNGFYVVMWGAWANGAQASSTYYMGISADGDTPSGQREMFVQSNEGTMSVGRMALVDFSLGNHGHTLQAKYKSCNFGFRWLHALRVVTE